MKITVPRDHTHAGVFYPAGSPVDLSEAEVAWLMRAERTTREKMVAEVPQPFPVVMPETQETIPEEVDPVADEEETE